MNLEVLARLLGVRKQPVDSPVAIQALSLATRTRNRALPDAACLFKLLQRTAQCRGVYGF
jgi:hypothetical protein